jgi:M6 family metalloprotease-like protein
MTPFRVRGWIVLSAGLLAVPSIDAQSTSDSRRAPQWEPPGFDISSNGGWRVKARRVAAARARLLAQRNFAALNAPTPAGAAASIVTGTLRVPAIMFKYQDSPGAQTSRTAATYDATLFGAVPPNGKPYTLRSFYEEMSNGLFSLQGQSTGWVALAGNEATYTGGTNCQGLNPYGLANCNGIWSFGAIAAMQAGLREALMHADSTVDFGLFDNDGPDGIPNSDDDDGIVDAVLFLHPSMDGACIGAPNNTHLWSHRYVLSATTPYTTNDNRTGGGKIVADDYILQSGLGTPGGGICDSTAIMPIGTAAHESGHLLDLPDLYDVSNQTQGIGSWGLMSAGNSTKPESPSRFEAWSLQQVGWTTVVPLSATATYSVGPEPTADTVFYVDVAPPNTQPEHFLIENRQAVQSDSALIRIQGGGGLMIWHIDDSKACSIGCGNIVNAGSIHGVALEEADGLRELWCEPGRGCDRGDAGDPYPGASGNVAFSVGTTPAATKNLDTTFAGVAIDSIQQLTPNGAMSFRLRFGAVTTVQASDTTIAVTVDADTFHLFRDLFDNGSSHTIAVPDTLTLGRTRYSFVSWSDAGAVAHSITGALAGATYTATVARAHRLDVAVIGIGTVSSNPPADTSGVYVTENSVVTLTATPTAPAVFGGWTGDTVASNPVLALPMGRPYQVSAHFDAQLAITSGDPRPAGVMAKPYADTLRATGGGGTFNWQLVGGSLPSGLALGISGRITGFPLDTGSFSFTARVTSGAQQAVQTYGLTITAPTLVQANVLAQLLNASGALTTDEIRYLDQIGNRTCQPAAINATCFDVGDFLAWVQLTGATPTPPPAAVVGKGGRP